MQAAYSSNLISLKFNKSFAVESVSQSLTNIFFIPFIFTNINLITKQPLQTAEKFKYLSN